MIDPEDIKRFWSRVTMVAPHEDGCWPWRGPVDRDGYGLFSTSRTRGGKRSWRAHRFAWQATNGGFDPGKLLVCHHCDNPACVRPSHLFLGTARDNFRDCLAKGRYSPKGAGNAAAKLKEEDVPKIRNLYATGQWSQQAIADIFGVHQTAVSAVVRGARWRHVDAA